MKLFLAFISMTFPYILFSFVAEQYIFCTFYLITAIYVWYFDHLKINYIYIGAVGTLTTSGIIFPLIGNLKFKKEWFKKVLKCFIVFAIVTIVGGQLFKFVDAPNSISALINGFSGTLTFSAKFNQFSHFISSIFFAPKAYIANDLNYYCYSLLPISSIDILGTCLLVICFISYYLNREEKIAKISILWIIFSFVILAVVGWGTRENCLILYSLYFSWSYIVLIFLFFKKIFPNSKKFEISIIIIIILMILRNIPEFINIINFGLKYYRR